MAKIKAAAKLPIETMAAIILFILVMYILAGPYLLGWVKGTVEKWTSSPQKREGNAISLALCEYRQGRAEYPFEWFSENAGDLREVAAGLSDCEWAKAVKVSVVDVRSGSSVVSCPASESAGLVAYLLWDPDPKISGADQYLFSRGIDYKVIAGRISDADVPDVCMCVTRDLQRHGCW